MTDTVAPADDLTFALKYDGPALQAHEMDVRDLAPALLSVADLFQNLNRAVNPMAPPLSVTVRATSEGSFLIELRVIYEVAKQVLLTKDAVAAGTLASLLGWATMLFQHRVQARRGPFTTEAAAEPGTVKVIYADGTTLIIPQVVLDAARTPAVQHDLSEIVRPLQRDGVAELVIQRDELVLVTVGKADMASFEAAVQPPDTAATTLGVNERDVFLTIRTVGFESHRWSFSDGAANFTATMRDDAFLDRVEQGESFSKLDILRCRIRETQTRDVDGLHTSIEVVEVIAHEPPLQGEFRLG